MSAAAPTAYLHRPAFVQIPLELLIASAERKGIAFVYGWLWHHAGRQDTAFPSIDTLAGECRMKADDVRLALRFLVEHGWVVRHERPGTTTLFHVRMEANRPPSQPAAAAKPSQPTPPPNGGPHPSPKRGTPPLPQMGGGNKNQRTRAREQDKNTPQPSLREGSPPLGAPPTLQAVEVVESVSGINSQQALAAADGFADQPVKRQRRRSTAESQQPLEIPVFAESCRSLLSAWQVLRRRRHRVSAEAALSPRSIKALEYAYENGVLQEFAELAAEGGWLSLGFNGHRDFIQKLAADGNLNATSRHSGSRTVGSAVAGRPTTRQADAAERAIALFSSSQEVTCSPPPTSSTSWPASSSPCPSTRLFPSEDFPSPGSPSRRPPSSS